jgi:hypothetical protein
MPARGIGLLLVLSAVALGWGDTTDAQETFRFAGAECRVPAFLHCPDDNCPSDRVINPGPVVEMKTRRTYFLDYPCDLKKGEPVTFILSLHGAGSYANWQRHYFRPRLRGHVPAGGRHAELADAHVV